MPSTCFAIESSECSFVTLRIGFAERGGIVERYALRHVAEYGIVRGGLVGKNVGHDAAAREFGNHVRAISNQAHGGRLALAHGIFQDAQSFVEIVDHHIAVAGLHAALDAFGIDVDAEECSAIQRGSEWLRSAHSAHTAADDEFAGEVAAEMFAPAAAKVS